MQRVKTISQRIILVLAMAVLVVFEVGNVATAATDPTDTRKGDLFYYTQNGIIFYEGGELHCSGDGGTVSGGAAGMLQKQKNLDSRWIPVILNEAKRAGADPVAMLSLLFWENRGLPKYDAKWGGSDSIGRGPWQITKATWPASAGPYDSGVENPLIATQVAADLVKSWGGVAGAAIGSIDQDFGKGKNIPSMASVAKNYNAGRYTWRSPASAGYKQSGRVWMNASRGPWFDQKQTIIDDYILAMTYAYYQVGTGQSLPPKGGFSNDEFVGRARENAQKIKDFKIGDGANVANECSAGSATGNGSVATVAMALGWPNRKFDNRTAKSAARQSYQSAMPKIHGGDPGNDAWSDCGVFVSTVIRLSGADKKYQLRGTGVQLDYVKKHPELYEVTNKYNSVDQVKPGDIFIVSGGGVGHTFVFTGKYKGDDGKNYDSMSASWHDRVPMAANAYFEQGGYQYHVARLKTANTAAETAGGTQ